MNLKIDGVHVKRTSMMKSEDMDGIDSYSSPDRIWAVTPRSPTGVHSAVYKMAVYFKHEFRYDFPAWPPPNALLSLNKRDRAFLWSLDDYDQPTIQVFGACSFRWVNLFRAGEPIGSNYTMGFVWLHPFMRRKGLLSEAWPYFKQRFGEFYLDAPLSEAIKSLLQKVDPEALGRLC